MRLLSAVITTAGMALLAAGCSGKSFDGPTVDSFVGTLVHDGKPVSFPEGEQVQLSLFHETGQSFNVPINNQDGSFTIGWMPIGKYTAMLIRAKPNQKGPGGSKYSVPGGLQIKEGQTKYTIELGKGWKP